MSDKYILGGEDGHTPVPVDDLMEWAEWLGAHNRTVAAERVGPYRVSTVFIGLDFNIGRLFGGGGGPLLFETMVFATGDNYPHHCDTKRCSTWDEAVEQHQHVVAELKRELSG